MSTQYEVWTTKDGRKVPVREMTDLHLLHTIRAIVEGRLFPGIHLMDDGFFPIPDEAADIAAEAAEQERGRWLTVFQAEAIRRGLDWSKPPTRKLALLDHLSARLISVGELPETVARWRDKFRSVMKFTEPVVDVCNKTGNATYLHWAVGAGVGTPLDRAPAHDPINDRRY